MHVLTPAPTPHKLNAAMIVFPHKRMCTAMVRWWPFGSESLLAVGVPSKKNACSDIVIAIVSFDNVSSATFESCVSPTSSSCV